MTQSPTQNQTPSTAPTAKRKPKNDWLVLVLVTLVMFGLFITTIIMIGWVYKDKMIASVVNLSVHTTLTELPLPVDQKKAIIHQTDRMYEAFLEKKLNVQDMGDVVEKLLHGPVFPVGVVYHALNHQIDISDLTDEQKFAAQIQVGRMAEAGIQSKFKPDQLQAIADLLKPDVDPDNPQPAQIEVQTQQTVLKEKLTTEELDDAVLHCQQLADDAQMATPRQPYVFDPSEHVRKVVDDLLGSQDTTELPATNLPS